MLRCATTCPARGADIVRNPNTYRHAYYHRWRHRLCVVDAPRTIEASHVMTVREKLSDMRFTNKVCVVTGGASGIGRATATAFADEGARVAVIDVDASRGEEATRRIIE